MELQGRYRHELKFQISQVEYEAIRRRLQPVMQREKFRIRYYNNNFSYITLEKKIKHNNLCMKVDATNMKEALVYDMFQYMGADASLYNYAKISVNGDYWGVYLALEGVEDSFILRNYGTQSGELYKPEGVGGGGMQGGPDGDFDGEIPQDGQNGPNAEFNGEMPHGNPNGAPGDYDPSQMDENNQNLSQMDENNQNLSQMDGNTQNPPAKPENSNGNDGSTPSGNIQSNTQ